MAKAVVLLLVACAISATLAQSNWDQAARDYVLDVHNDYRRNEGGCQINKLEYDFALEAQAKVWAEKCEFRHELIKGRGENLAYTTSKEPEETLIKKMAAAWFAEKEMYHKGQPACLHSCHYTQLVWHNTEKVGCYSTRCPRLSQANAKNAWYLVCFYTPMGNWVGQEPYKTQCDTPCKNGQTPENGLCVGHEIIPCENNNGSCEGWADRGECTNEKSKAYMEKYCRKACEFCT